jgi:uncharacterized protein GlcG (DUF336 family)
MTQRTAALSLTLAQASTIVDEALVAARAADLEPMTVVALDAGGHVVACKREDRSGILRFEVAFGKAWAALGMGRPSRDFESMSAARPAFVNSLAAVAQGRFVPVPGGVLVLGDDERIIGAVGVSGDTSAADETCAIAGIRAAGLLSNPAMPPAQP